MKYISEFRDGETAKKIAGVIRREAGSVRIMEFCGGHTITLLKYGIPDMMPEGVRLISGPGCPVCVTSKAEIDAAIKLSARGDVILASFGDMIRVPGTTASLRDAMARGANVQIVYSPDDAVRLALEEPAKKVVFFSVGFETTAPVTAAAVRFARAKNAKNFFVLSAHKTTPGILAALLGGEVRLDAFVCPGHVTTITGTAMYAPLTEAGKPCVVSGFEPLDIMRSILMIVRQMNSGRAETEVEYSRVVSPEGNGEAQRLLSEVFAPADAVWRGIGPVKGSGLRLKGDYEAFDAPREFGLEPAGEEKETPGCICGLILRGVKKPTDCKLFARACTPEEPVGACMVSDEGTCSVYYRFHGKG